MTQLTLGSVMVDEFDVALAVQNELLLLSLGVGSLLNRPLLLEHFLLSLPALLLSLRHLIALIALPRQNVHGVGDLLLFLECLALFSLLLLLGIKHPQLGVHLLFGDGLLELRTLVHQLLFTLQLRAGHHELGLFSAQVVRLHLELPISSLLDRVLLFDFALLLEVSEALSHLLSNLFRRFQVFHELLFVLGVLAGKQISELGATGVQVGVLSSSEILNPILGDVLYDEVVRLGFPTGLEVHVLVASNGVVEHCFLLYESRKVIVSAENRMGCGIARGGCTYEFGFAARHDLGVRLELCR